jgi:hypothetical protein
MDKQAVVVALEGERLDAERAAALIDFERSGVQRFGRRRRRSETETQAEQ